MKLLHTLFIFFLLLVTPFSYADWIPFELENNLIVIDIQVNDQKGKAVLDTGAEMNMISSYTVDKHGKNFTKAGQVNLIGVNGREKADVYNRIPIRLLGQELSLNGAVEGALGGHQILFGRPFFKNIIVQIDFPNSRLMLLNRKAVDMRKHANVPMKKQRGSKLPAVQVTVNEKNVWLTFDTGNSGGIYIKRSYALENEWVNENTKLVDSTVSGLVRQARVENFQLPDFKIGPYELEQVEVAMPAKGENVKIGRHANEVELGSHIQKGVQTKGILGYDVLKHFIVTLDLAAYKLHIFAP